MDRNFRRRTTCWSAGLCSCCLAAVLLAPAAAVGEPRGSPPPELGDRVASLLEELDADQFNVRHEAAGELEKLIATPDAANVVARQIHATLGRADLSFEVRKQLETWLPTLPAVPPQPLTGAADEPAQLVDQLDDDSFALRLGASRRLELLARDPSRAIDLAFHLRDRLAEPNRSPGSMRRLVDLWETARGTWLTSDPATWKLPPVSDAAIEQAVDALAASAPETHQGAWPKHAIARRELLDMLAQDEVAPRVKQALEKRLQPQQVDEAAAERLNGVLEWTIPALVAEIWQSRENILVQHLYVDVPQHSTGAPRPSHFSRIDDRTATCVSGSNLEPGEYPVGVAIPHSSGKDWMCQLINLPNARRRQAFEYAARIDQRQRLAELTERTIGQLAERRKPMPDVLINALDKLDPVALSEHIGSYLLKLDDQPVEHGSDTAGGPRATHHQRICFMVAMLGTRHAGPDLVQIIKEKRCRAPSFETTPFNWPAIAALAIAERDPWADSELWLVSQITSVEPLALVPNSGDVGKPSEAQNDQKQTETPQAVPQLGPGAAALLLRRYDLAPESFGLIAVENEILENVVCPCYRFKSPEGPQRVLDWWQRMQGERTRRQSP